MVKTYELFAGVLNRFECDIDHLKQTEWPALKVRMKRDNNNTRVQDFYRRRFTNPNQKETLKNILVLAEIILCITMSSDICERGFFCYGQMKIRLAFKAHPRHVEFSNGDIHPRP